MNNVIKPINAQFSSWISVIKCHMKIKYSLLRKIKFFFLPLCKYVRFQWALTFMHAFLDFLLKRQNTGELHRPLLLLDSTAGHLHPVTRNTYGHNNWLASHYSPLPALSICEKKLLCICFDLVFAFLFYCKTEQEASNSDETGKKLK